MKKEYNFEPATPERQKRARIVAVEARRNRQAFKKRIKAGEFSVRGAIEYARTDKQLGRLYVNEFLRAFPSIGHVKARAAMESCGIIEKRRVSGLSDKRVALLEKWFADRS